MTSEPSGEYYDYTKTMKPERPWLLPYHQSLVWKTMNAYKGPDGELKEVCLTFQQTLDLIERVHNMTLGIPQVVYLTGWQYNGHDSKYPAWGEVNEALKRPEDATALESLRWLFKEARERFGCRISLHVNMMDAYKDSPLWDEYFEKDVIAKDKEGNPIPCQEWSGMMAYAISYTQEWKLGLAQRRIDALIEMIPELVESGTIHIDAFLGVRKNGQQEPISPLLGYTKEEEAATQRKIYRYFRDRGIDVTSEWVYGMRVDRFVGLQPWAWHQENKVEDLPDELYCSTKWVGSDMWVNENPQDPPHVREKFYLEVLPWYYKNNPGAAGEQKMLDGTDVCMPALWCEKPPVIAYSQEGYDKKTWELHPDWKDVEKVALAKITYDGAEDAGTAEVEGGKLTLGVKAGEALRITPA